MDSSSTPIDVYFEIGQKRAFVGAIDWPGWCRIGRDSGNALQALVDSGPRLARILESTPLGFQAPANMAALRVVERLPGNATTDFGAPDVLPSADRAPFGAADLERSRVLLTAYWSGFDAAVAAAAGKELRKGPRGGGRDLEEIVRHVIGADGAYLSRLGQKPKIDEKEEPGVELARTREMILDALAAAARGELPERGPRGGAIWPARYAVRRIGWHVLDHTWEIEDRAS